MNHCRHCAEDCPGGRALTTVTQTVQVRWHLTAGASWEYDSIAVTCPACIESERIAEAIEAKAREVCDQIEATAFRYYGVVEPGSVDPDLQALNAALIDAARIARGDR